MIGCAIGNTTQEYLGVNNHSVVIATYEANLHINTFQLFLMGPTDYNKLDCRVETFRAHSSNGIKLYAHAAYRTAIRGRSTYLLQEQFKLCNDQGFIGLVCHLQKKPPLENSHSIIELVTFARKSSISTSKFLFEINGVVSDKLPAGESHTFETPEKINYLISLLTPHIITYNDVGFCLDTSHVWTGGVSLRDSRSVRTWLNTVIDPRWIQLIHLNDSKSPCGGKDVHTWIGLGEIWPVYAIDRSTDTNSVELSLDAVPLWNEDPALSQTDLEREWGYVEIIRWAKKHNIDVILERNGNVSVSHLSEIRSIRRLWDIL